MFKRKLRSNGYNLGRFRERIDWDGLEELKKKWMAREENRVRDRPTKNWKEVISMEDTRAYGVKDGTVREQWQG